LILTRYPPLLKSFTCLGSEKFEQNYVENFTAIYLL